jgi:large subunit ribosomal protein L4
MQGILKALKVDGGSLLVATAGIDKLVYLSARNIDKVSISSVADLNALAILMPRKMLVTKEALDVIKQRATVAAE